MTKPQLIPLSHLAILDVTGDDAQSFLQAQVPSDIRTLNPEKAQISGWCTAKGRLLTTFVIWPIDQGYRLVLAADVREAIAKRLKMFVLRLKVQITSASDQVFGLMDSETRFGTMTLPVAEWQVTQENGITAIRLDPTRILLTGPQTHFTALANEADVGPENLWLRADITQGFPLVTQATSEHFVPQMVNLDKLGGVSFKKGCYPGQEIVARTHYLGKIKRHLYRVSAQQALTTGAEVRSILLNGQACGSLLTVAPAADGSHWLGLAVLQQDAAEGELIISSGESQMPLTVIDLVLPDAG